MSMEMWNIDLHYEDGNQSQRVLQRSMDRDYISYFDLVGLIEQVGFFAIDFLYYKKKDSHGSGNLVHIDNDSHVRTMISEHEIEKSVELYVFRKRADTDIAPSNPSREDDGPTAGLEDDGIFEEEAVKHRTRRPQKILRRSKRLNVVQSGAQYTNIDHNDNAQSLPLDEPMHETQALGDNEDHVEHQDDRVLNTRGDGKDVGKRGRTALPAVWNMTKGERIVVKCNTLGQPIGEEGGVLGKFLGTIARLGGYCPLNKKDWRDVKKDGGDETILHCVQTKFLYPAKCDKWILKTTRRNWRRFKASLKKDIFNAKKKRKALYKLCPEEVENDQWRKLVKFWKSKEGRAISEKNKISRVMVKTTHTAGTKSYARWAEELRQEDPEKKQPHRAKVYLATHRKKAEDQNEHVVELEKLIDEQPELAQNDQGRVAWQGDALHQVLGKEKPGQVHGMGLLPIPKQVYGRTPRYLKNINMTTRNGSSSEGETDVREEIAKLKQHIAEQDQIIEALRNKDEGHGNNETTEENFGIGDNGNSRSQVVQTKRKRVHCNGPDPLRSLNKERDAIANNETLLHHDDMREDNDMMISDKMHPECEGGNEVPYEEGTSSPSHHVFDSQREMRKTKGKMDANLRRPQQQHTQNNIIGHMPSDKRHTPSMEVGTTVILKSSTNKRRVAYATFLDCTSNTLVGGEKLGVQFMHVKVDQPIGKDENLVRERENCKTIRDAFASGLTIAWPSTCIEDQWLSSTWMLRLMMRSRSKLFHEGLM